MYDPPPTFFEVFITGYNHNFSIRPMTPITSHSLQKYHVVEIFIVTDLPSAITVMLLNSYYTHFTLQRCLINIKK